MNLSALLLCFLFISDVDASNGERTFAETRVFTFHHNLWLNAHHWLRNLARMQGNPRLKDKVAQMLADLNEQERQVAAEVTAYYRERWAPADLLFDKEMLQLKKAVHQYGHLALEKGSFSQALKQNLSAWAPVYQAHWWDGDRKNNEAKVHDFLKIVKTHEETLVQRLPAVYGTSWQGKKIRVDVVRTGHWAPAYTTDDPDHIIFLSANRSTPTAELGLEIMFHEASHLWFGEIYQRLAATFSAAEKDPGRLWHTLLFVSVGHEVRRILGPQFRTYSEFNGLDQRQPRLYQLARQWWIPYLDGKITRDEAFKGLVKDWP